MGGQKLKTLFSWMLVGLFLFNSESFAGEAQRVWTAFRQEDGLAHNMVTAVVQTPDGAMWFATLSGISRYDGHGWKTFGVEDGLPGTAVFDLVATPDNTVWAALGRRLDRQPQQALAYFFSKRVAGRRCARAVGAGGRAPDLGTGQKSRLFCDR